MAFTFKTFLILSLIPLGIYAIFCFGCMFTNVASGKWRINALMPLALFTPSLFNEDGNTYRKRALAINLIGIIIMIYVFSVNT